MSSEALERAIRAGLQSPLSPWSGLSRADIAEAHEALTELLAALAVAREREQRLRTLLAKFKYGIFPGYISEVRAALVDEPAAATLAEPGRGECKPAARVGEECSPVTADVTTSAPGSASAAAGEPTAQKDMARRGELPPPTIFAADEPGETPGVSGAD